MKDRMNVYFGSYVTYCYLSVNKEFVCLFVLVMGFFGVSGEFPTLRVTEEYGFGTRVIHVVMADVNENNEGKLFSDRPCIR